MLVKLTCNFTLIGIRVIEEPLNLVRWFGDWKSEGWISGQLKHSTTHAQQYLFGEHRWWSPTCGCCWPVQHLDLRNCWTTDSKCKWSEFQELKLTLAEDTTCFNMPTFLGFLCFSNFSADHGNHSVNLFAWSNLPELHRRGHHGVFWVCINNFPPCSVSRDQSSEVPRLP